MGVFNIFKSDGVSETSIKKDIFHNYRDEYRAKYPLNKTYKILKNITIGIGVISAIPFVTAAAMATSTVLPFMLLSGVIGLNFFMAPTGIAALAAKWSLDQRVKKDIKEDIRNGKLVHRYQREILPRQGVKFKGKNIHKLAKQQAKLQHKNELAQEFKRAAYPEGHPSEIVNVPVPTVFNKDGSRKFKL